MTPLQVLKYNRRKVVNLEHLAKMVLFDEEEYLQFELSDGVSIFQYPEMLNKQKPSLIKIYMQVQKMLHLANFRRLIAMLKCQMSLAYGITALLAQETVILEAEHIEESTDAVLKEHAIPAPISEDLSEMVLSRGGYFADPEEDESDSAVGGEEEDSEEEIDAEEDEISSEVADMQPNIHSQVAFHANATEQRRQEEHLQVQGRI